MANIFKYFWKAFFVFLLFVCSHNIVNAQSNFKTPLFAEKGFIVGYGNGIDSLNIPEGKYTVVYLMAHLGIDIFRNSQINQNRLGKTFVIFEPQLNPVFIKSSGKTLNAFEFGVNVGVQHLYPLLKDKIHTYIQISAGPHFMSAHTTRQARGFLFSDNLSTGMYLRINQSLIVNLSFRLRHLSNADTRSPNQGINTFNYHIGFSKLLIK